MNPQQIKNCREVWIPALLSGEYHQTTGWMSEERNGECYYCCLGVAASLRSDVKKVARETSLVGGVAVVHPYFVINENEIVSTTYRAEQVMMPSIGEHYGVVEGHYLQVPDEAVRLEPMYLDKPENVITNQPYRYYYTPNHRISLRVDTNNYSRIDLSDLNDTEQYTFAEIAEVIEQVCSDWEKHEHSTN